MSETAGKSVRLSKVTRDFNLGVHTVVEFLAEKGHAVEESPNAKIPGDLYALLEKEFGQDKAEKEASKQVIQERQEREVVALASVPEPVAPPESASAPPVADAQVAPAAPAEKKAAPKAKSTEPAAPAEPSAAASDVFRATTLRVTGPKTIGKIDLDSGKKGRPAAKVLGPEKPAPAEKPAEKPAAKVEVLKAVAPEPETIRVNVEKLAGPKTVGKIELPKERERKPSDRDKDRGRRKRIVKPGPVNVGRVVQQEQRNAPSGRPGELDENAVKRKVSETLARLTGGGGSKGRGAKRKGDKRQERYQRREEENQARQLAGRTLQVTEFVTASELASMMDVPVTDIIKAYFSLGMMVSINQRLDAETLAVIADEYGFKVEFVGADVQDTMVEEADDPERMVPRAPIVTVMGHVDHGKTSLLDHIRKANVIAGEAGGITQHIGAYSVTLDNGKRIAFLDTPGHEAFTAMRARGAQVTDIAIIVIAADDSVMPQTREAINHAQAAGVPMVFAFNKIDKEGANAEKIRDQLSQMNILVEEWGGKFQTQEISAKKGTGIEQLLDKVLLEADLLELKADPEKRATGVVIESTLEVGRGYVTTLLVEGGTLHKSDILLVGQYSGRVRNMFNERGQQVTEAGPSVPVSILGLDGAPNAGDRFHVMADEREARQIATRRQQLQREQGIRTHKHITLDEIGRRLAIGDFKELNVIVKGDVDGSVEALTDSLLKLSTESIKVNVIHKAVGPIAESDVLLASASNAIIVGFQVRPTVGARKLAENEEIEIRLYSIIYDAIEELKLAMEGMLTPKEVENVIGTAEVRDTFRISKVGTVAGCYVLDGKITRNSKIRLIRDSIVVYTGELSDLKRFKDDAKEVTHGYECGLSIKNFNDIKVGDNIEAFEMVEVKRTLEG
ncbi:MAG: translation initiation factor IF-2 [Flavobacteriales bacterium]|nr:translation initiation factor IF-2 [Flavobacteriales bacterium]MBK6893133.1 translation initiation factor IF-2 [Flavobacteriales bacterium]MBK7249146.1 translation initiation factor IF-2 [Flavobacteriales bacterium]MBK9599827.1 translation initiation factor IF-2 [Flavobacteriales bacterium]QQS71374.1 MAG: translation initiation factor IF-2 [Flavobacteriales bacterium]